MCIFEIEGRLNTIAMRSKNIPKKGLNIEY